MIGIDTNPDGLALTMIDCKGNYKWHTYIIGLYMYCHQYGMDVHNGAAMVIARRSHMFKEKIPKGLKEKLVSNINKFDNKNGWSKWDEINKNIKGKVGEKPARWLMNRKKILGIA